jgi:hypothetical protein
MLSRRFILCAMLCLALVVPAVPAGAADTYGPRIEVLQAHCEPDAVHADAVAGIDGLTRGFSSYFGDDCNQRIRWFEGAASSWTTARTRYRGVVMATAHDGTGTWLLFANAGGVRIGRRSNAGVEQAPVLVDSKGLGGALFPTGDLLVAGGRWLAVWSRQVGPGGEFAQTELFSAQTLGQGHCFSAGLHKQRLTDSRFNDDAPTLAPIGDDDATPRLVWERNDGAQGLRSNLRAGRQPFDDCLWRHHRYTAYGDLNTEPDATRGLESRLLTWRRDGEILVDGGRAFARRVLGSGFSPRISHTGASTHVAWINTASHVSIAQRALGGAWTETDLTPDAVAFQQLVAVTGTGGKATVLIFSPGTDRLTARTQS